MLPNTNGMNADEAAAALANVGVRVFPCSSGGATGKKAKVPLVSDWANVATNNLKKVQKDWPPGVARAIGLPTGTAQMLEEGQALVVIDTDLKHDSDGEASLCELEERLGPLPVTYTVRTPSGGKHRYYFAPADASIRNSAGQLGKGIDVRGDGGYVVAPGSELFGGGRYDVITHRPPGHLPTVWVEKLKNPKVRKKTKILPKRAIGATNKRRRAVADLGPVEDAVISVKFASPGERNNTLNREAFALGRYVGRGDLEADEVRQRLLEASVENGLVDDDGIDSVMATIESGLGDGIEEPLPMSEDRLAVIFAEQFEDQYLYDHTRGQWFYWDGAIWRQDRIKRTLMAVRELIRVETGGKPNLNKTVTAQSVLRAASADPKIAIDHEGWNSDPWLLGVPDGVVDLRTGKHLPPDPKLRIYMATSVSPDPVGTACPRWEAFIDEVTGGDAELARYLQQICGYMLTGFTHEEVFFFLHGAGGNGKGVFIGTAGAIMGDYAKSAPMETFMASKGERHLAELARLAHARLVTASETEEGRSLAVSRIKEITGNERPITANFMRQNHFEFKVEFKLVMVGNNKPKIRSVDKAIERRMRLLPFQYQPEKPDPTLKKALVAEYPAILRWMIDGGLSWQQKGFETPASVQSATREYLDEEDTKTEWFEARVNVVPEQFTSSAMLFADWEYFARSNGYYIGKKNDLSRWLKNKGYHCTKRNGVRGFEGLKLQPPEEFVERNADGKGEAAE